MFPLRDENPHPPGFKPKLTIAFIIVNVIVFFYEVAYTGQFFEFTNGAAARLFYEWGAVPSCLVYGALPSQLPFACPPTPQISLVTSVFLHGGLMHLGGNMLFLWIFGDNIEHKFGRSKFFIIYMAWGIVAGLAHVAVDPASTIPAVGASGAISGVLGAYLAIFPRAKIHTFMMLGFFWRMMRIEARWYLPFWFVFQNILPFVIGGFGTTVEEGWNSAPFVKESWSTICKFKKLPRVCYLVEKYYDVYYDKSDGKFWFKTRRMRIFVA